MIRQESGAKGLTRIALGLIVGVLMMPLVAGAASPTIEIWHHHVSPAELSIQRGETVTFINLVDMFGGHRIVADDGSFSSPPLQKDDSWDHAFEKTGTFIYRLEEHPGTEGVIHVE